MELQDVRTREDLEKLYAQNNILEIAEKTAYLKKSMQIRASRSDIHESPEDALRGLEEITLSRYWIGLSR